VPTTSWRRVALLAIAVALTLGAAAAPAWSDPPKEGPPLGPPAFGAVVTEHLTASLLGETVTVRPGEDALVAVKLEIEEHWHVYWINPGDSGTEVEIAWDLPDGWKAGPILWTAPTLMRLGDFVSYGYEGTAWFPVRISVPADAAPGNHELKASVGWLVCKDSCEPGDAELSLTVVVGPEAPKPGPHQAEFEAFKKTWPAALPDGASMRARPAGAGAVELVLQGKGPWSDPAAKLYLFALTDKLPNKDGKLIKADVADPRGPQNVVREGDVTALRVPQPAKRKLRPERLQGILVVEDAAGRHPYAVDVPVLEGGEGPLTGTSGGPTTSFGWLLLGALLGGVILNIMPCVLPVLSIKILGFVSQADEQPVKVRRHGYAFGAGVLLSFWFLAAIVLAVRAGGEELGWGFQLQNPIVVVAMAVLMFAVGVNLAGVYEFGLGVQTLAGDAATKIHVGGYMSSFWSGALATVIATPCTAPMMGPAIGYAMVAPAIESLLLFTALGVGMAAPYVLLSMSPKLLKKMPRPGPWMDHFKHALAFPMFAAVIWLVSVFGAQTHGVPSITWLLAALLLLGLGLWFYGTWGTPGTAPRKRWVVGYGFALLCALGSFLLIQKAMDPHAGKIQWEPWSPERVAEARGQGHPVFVDFTAEWCVSCLAQEAAILETDEVKQVIKELGVVMLKADFTTEDPKVLAGLREFGRSSVPLWLVYSPDLTLVAVVLPQVATVSDVVDALRKAAASKPPPPAPR
jgi:thiol:disulfide interchange protein DsbD